MQPKPTTIEHTSTTTTDQPELPRLLRALRRNRGSGIFFARCNTPVLRDRLITTIQAQLGRPVALVHLASDGEALIDHQIQRAISDNSAPVVFILDLEIYLSGLDEARQQRVLWELNWRRGPLNRLGRSLVFWLPDFALNLLAREAPDFFDWRSGVYEFENDGEMATPGLLNYTSVDGWRLLSLDAEEKRRRIETLESLIQEAEAEGTSDSGSLARLKHDLALLLAQQGHTGRALSLLEESLQFTEQTGDVKGKATMLHQIADVAAEQGDVKRALSLWDESLQLYEQVGDVQGRAATVHQIACVIAEQGNVKRALSLWDESLQLYEQVGDVRGKAVILYQIAGVLAEQGDVERALSLWEKSLQFVEQIGDVQGKAATLHNMAGVIAEQGDVKRALSLLEESLQLMEQIGDVQGEAVTLSGIAWLADRQGDLKNARECYLEAASSLIIIRAWSGLHTVLANLGMLGEGSPAYLAQAFWLCLFTGVPLRSTVGTAGQLLQKIGVEHAAAPFIATTALLLLTQRGENHPELQTFQQRASAMITACAAARGIAEDKAQEWFIDQRLNDPNHVLPAVQQALIDIVGDTEWLFDRQEVAAQE